MLKQGNKMKKKIEQKVLGAIVASVVAISSHAGEIDVIVNGLSYHLDSSQGYVEAPNKLDDKAQWVFNPGIGLSYDFRKNISEDGFSPYLTASWFQDCSNTPFYYAGGGVRYRKYLTTNFMMEFNVAGAVANGAVYDDFTGLVTDERETTFLPVANIGIGYKITSDYLVKTNFTYVPENDNVGGTSGTDLIYMQVSFCF